MPGSVYVGRPGAWRRHRWAVPMGPEDLTYWPSTDGLWSLTEHPRRRWVFAMRRSRLAPLTAQGQVRASRSNRSPVCTGTTQNTSPPGSARIV